MALRDPDKTRNRILNVAAGIFHQKGYNCTSLSDILAGAEVSKGALYHHFSNKEELLFAVVEEVYKTQFLAPWREIVKSDSPLDAMAELIEANSRSVSTENMCAGCPVFNIASELSAINDGLRQKVDGIFRELYEIIYEGLEQAKANNQVEQSVDSDRVCLMILSCLNGMPQIVKSCLDLTMFRQINSGLADYIKSFKL